MPVFIGQLSRAFISLLLSAIPRFPLFLTFDARKVSLPARAKFSASTFPAPAVWEPARKRSPLYLKHLTGISRANEFKEFPASVAAPQTIRSLKSIMKPLRDKGETYGQQKKTMKRTKV